jgi:hypothetical protein
MRSAVPIRRIALALLLSTAGCDDATGNVLGGESLTSEAGCEPTFTSLYANYFGPSGQATCTAQASCHGTAAASGAMTSGFVCGQTKESCWQGMTMGIPADAGGVFPPIAPPNAGDPTQTQLYGGLHKSKASGLNNMPCGGNLVTCPSSGSTYTFTPDDLSCISTWLQQGAQDN